MLNERLLDRGVDIDTVVWDSYRLDDGRWSVTADYLTGETPRQAVFSFDVAGRYSVAGNDEARWVLGDTSPAAVRSRVPRRRPVSRATTPSRPSTSATSSPWSGRSRTSRRAAGRDGRRRWSR